LFKRGDIIQRKIKSTETGGTTSMKAQAEGVAPRGKWLFVIDVKGGEIVTLM
jgi:hypothetical protein